MGTTILGNPDIVMMIFQPLQLQGSGPIDHYYDCIPATHQFVASDTIVNMFVLAASRCFNMFNGSKVQDSTVKNYGQQHNERKLFPLATCPGSNCNGFSIINY